VKVGDLVKHREDEVLGFILGQIPNHKCGFRFIVKWCDMPSTNEESPEWLSLVSTAYKKDENNLNISEQPTSN
jgi:hypothetical protein